MTSRSFHYLKNQKPVKMQTPETKAAYTLRATDTKRISKGNKFLYELVAPNGGVVATRTSDKRYIARLVHDNVFFGRATLINKGDHARLIKAAIENYDDKRVAQLNMVAYLDAASVAMFDALDASE